MRFEIGSPEDVAFPELCDIHFVHDEIALFEGGTSGLLNEGHLLSAMARPCNVLIYGAEASAIRPDLITLASYICHGIASAHAYVDGNKRTAVLVMMAFLAQNGVSYDAAEDEIGLMMDRWYGEKVFSVDVLDAYLRTKCHWARY